MGSKNFLIDGFELFLATPHSVREGDVYENAARLATGFDFCLFSLAGPS
jgi:hypothetical protein